MSFPLTGTAYLILFVALGFLALRFFQYWRKKKDITSKLFLLIVLPLVLFALVRAVSVLFFVWNPSVLKGSITLVAFLESLSAAVVAYFITYSRFPKISPWLGFTVILFFGFVITAFSANIQYQPTLEEKGVIDWGFPSGGANAVYPLLRLIVILVTFIPLIVILFQQFLRSQDGFIRRRTLGLSLVLFLGIILGSIDFVFNNILGLKAAIYRDYTTIVMGFLIFMIVLFTQKPSN
ncbi:MAG: hypothetical protein PHE52_03290 [Candidatus Pacebacteria bacterium]|nr:hypothetical protein [Candidatus Paceibacterota bacterium]